MNYAEEQRLRKLYLEELTDQALIEAAQDGPDAYQEGVYDIILEAISSRQLDAEVKHIDKELVSTDGFRWFDVCQYDDEIIKLRIEEFFKELDIEYQVFPQINRIGQPTGKGRIKVRQDCLDQAERVLVDLEYAKEFPQLFMDEQLIKDSIISVLNQRQISGADDISAQIIQQIKLNSKQDFEQSG
jgi:hypothetical protein